MVRRGGSNELLASSFGAAPLIPPGEPEESLMMEAERLLATVDGLCIHALLQPDWMTYQMCLDVLERHLDGLGAGAGSITKGH